MNNLFLREVRSITVVYSAQNNEELLDESRIVSWIMDYDYFFKTEIGVNNQQSLHLLFGRTLNILGPNLLEKLSRVVKIAMSGKDCGLSVGVQLSLREAIDLKENYKLMINSGIFNKIFLDFRDFSESFEENISAQIIVKEIICAKISLAILARPAVLDRIGILSLPELNSANFQIIPEANNQVKLNFCDFDKKRKTIPIYPVSSPQQIYDPCATRMQIFIDECGGVYPCQGLSKLPKISLCNVNTPFDGKIFSDKNEEFSLSKLFEKGPDISECYRGENMSICQKHRNMFL